AYEVAIRQVEFSTTDGRVGTSKRVLVTVSDGTNTSPEGNAFIHIDAASTTPPVLDLDANNSNASGPDYTATYSAGGTPTSIADIDISITDANSTTLASATIQIQNWNQPSGDTLSVSGSLPVGITASSYDPVTMTLTLSGTATLADYETAIRQV